MLIMSCKCTNVRHVKEYCCLKSVDKTEPLSPPSTSNLVEKTYNAASRICEEVEKDLASDPTPREVQNIEKDVKLVQCELEHWMGINLDHSAEPSVKQTVEE